MALTTTSLILLLLSFCNGESLANLVRDDDWEDAARETTRVLCETESNKIQCEECFNTVFTAVIKDSQLDHSSTSVLLGSLLRNLSSSIVQQTFLACASDYALGSNFKPCVDLMKGESIQIDQFKGLVCSDSVVPLDPVTIPCSERSRNLAVAMCLTLTASTIKTGRCYENQIKTTGRELRDLQFTDNQKILRCIADGCFMNYSTIIARRYIDMCPEKHLNIEGLRTTRKTP